MKYPLAINHPKPGPSCLKLTMSLVNDSLKFTSSDTQIYFIFFSKKIRMLYIESAKTVNEMILNELVKLTTLWTTGPRSPQYQWTHQVWWKSIDIYSSYRLEIKIRTDGWQSYVPPTWYHNSLPLSCYKNNIARSFYFWCCVRENKNIFKAGLNYLDIPSYLKLRYSWSF